MINFGRKHSFIGGLTINKLVPLWFLVALVLTVSIFVKGEDGSLKAKEENSASIDNSEASDEGYSDIENYNIGAAFYKEEVGRSSWYGKRFHHRKTAGGERYDMYGYTAAHRTLPFGTIVRVTNLENNKTVLVRINDRGPFVHKRIIDLSMSAVKDIDAYTSDMVKLETMINDQIADAFRPVTAQKFYFGYSFDRPLVCLPQSTLRFIDTAYDFNKAVALYKQMLTEYKTDLYLVAAIDQAPSDSDDIPYYIATYSPFDDKRISSEEFSVQR